MRFLQRNLGRTRNWLFTFLVLGFLLIFSPSINAGFWHMKHSSTVQCNTFSVRIPFFWTGSDDRYKFESLCTNGFYLVKLGSTLFGSSDNGSSLTFRPASKDNWDRTVASSQRVFQQTHGNAPPAPYNSISKFRDCYSIGEKIGNRQIVNVLCADEARDLIIEYSGSPTTAGEAFDLIK